MSRRTQDPLGRERSFDYRAVTFSGRPFQTGSSTPFLSHSHNERSYNPKRHASWFGLFPFRSPLLRESRLLSSPPGTKMFQFPGCALHALWIQAWILPHYGQWVPPFGHLRINACLQLPGAFRRLPRPSSAPSAKASTVRPF